MTTDQNAPEIKWQGKYITVRQQGTWEYVSRSRGIRAAVILAVDEAGPEGPCLILVEQYRVPLGRRCLELPAGLVGDTDDVNGEEAADAALRELEEETGYRAERMVELGDFYSSPGMVSESFWLFRAHGLTRVHNGGGVSGEDITVHRVPVPQLAEYVAARRAEGFGIDVKLLLALGSGMMAG